MQPKRMQPGRCRKKELYRSVKQLTLISCHFSSFCDVSALTFYWVVISFQNLNFHFCIFYIRDFYIVFLKEGLQNCISSLDPSKSESTLRILESTWALGSDLGLSHPPITCWLCAVWPLTNYLTSLNCSFLLYLKWDCNIYLTGLSKD